jgi:ABC-type glycerol-3-phosphate transport system permease component
LVYLLSTPVSSSVKPQYSYFAELLWRSKYFAVTPPNIILKVLEVWVSRGFQEELPYLDKGGLSACDHVQWFSS